jgi:uncharacterized protein (TIGR01777 family)
VCGKYKDEGGLSMRVLISGSHGLVGEALIGSLTNDGHEIHRLVRRGRAVGSSEIEWHPNQGLIDVEHLEGLDAVVHLAGESIASGRWNEEKKRKIRDSRVKGTSLLSRSLQQLSRPPATFICASAIGYYGNRGDQVLTEVSSPGNDFLSQVCVEWEESTQPAVERGIRTVTARFGIILDKEGGALAKMLPPFRMGVGGRIGDGKHWMSWIALGDVIGGLRLTITNQTLNGPVNFVAPNPVTNAEFTKALGKTLSRPTLFPIPAFGLRLAFGEMADALLLASQRVEPTRLKEVGYGFGHSEIGPTLSRILR